MVSKWARRTDHNQVHCVDALKKIGCTVIDLSRVGQGCPDLMVGFRGFTILLEIKNVDGRNKLTERQKEWIDTWRGSPVHVVRSPQQAVEAVQSYGY